MNRNSAVVPLLAALIVTVVSGLAIPLAGPMIGGLVAGLAGRHARTVLWAGFGSALAWTSVWIIHSVVLGNAGNAIQEQVAATMGLPEPWLLIPASGLLAGLTGSLAAWAGRSWHL